VVINDTTDDANQGNGPAASKLLGSAHTDKVLMHVKLGYRDGRYQAATA